jgi:hypothetical protein
MQGFKRWLAISMVFFVLTLTACGPLLNPGPTPTPLGILPLAIQFRDLYEKLGGEPVLGPSISDTFSHDGQLCQYTENILVCFNPNAKVDADRLVLVPLGPLIVKQQAGSTPAIYDGFKEMYLRLFGERYVGKPLSGVRYNKEKRRIEQYFEKMGFYRQIDDPRGTVRLMAYGLFVCRDYCAYHGNSDNGILGWNTGIPVPAATSLIRLGGFNTFGNPISQPYTTPSDGATEQLLENVLTYIPKDNPNTVRLRPLALNLKVRIEAPGPQVYTAAQGMVFYAVQGNLGYHVPKVFDEFIAAHGGIEISGKPTSDPFNAEENEVKVARQCFENYCLSFDPTRSEGNQIHLAPLGSQYLKQVNEQNWVFQFSPQTTILKIAELKPQISSKEEQVIQISVFQKEPLLPISDIGSVLVVGLPDGTRSTFNMTPTDLAGLSTISIPPVTNAANGSVVPYVVCLNVPTDTPICEAASFLIWNIR